MRKDNIVVIPRILLYDFMVLFIHQNAEIIYVVSRCEIACKSVLSSLQILTQIVGKI